MHLTSSDPQPKGPVDTFIQPKITGYRQLNPDEAELINQIKAAGDGLGTLVAALRAASDPKQFDQRWVSIGATHLQQGIMALVRSVAQPTSF